MLVYIVSWNPDQELCKGKGRVSKFQPIYFTVLCRSSVDAMCCLNYIFHKKYVNSDIDLCDGIFRLLRSKIDSRGFHVDYLYCDGISKPICLHDVKKSLIELQMRYH